MKSLYACLHAGDFPVAACLRERWNRQPPAALVFSGTVPNAYVYSANEAARAAGVREGMTLSQAEARFIVSEAAVKRKAKLLALPRDEQAEEQAQRELLDAALNVSPRVESSGPGLLVLDLNGLPNPHRAADVLARQAERLGLASNVAVSQNRFVAVAAAQTLPGITHVFPDEVRGFLGRLPIGVFPLTGEERKILRLWGIRTVGEFARLPQDSLATRFGERGAWLARLAQGEDDAVFKAWEAPHAFEESLDFDWPVCELDPLSFPLAELLRKICGELQTHGSAAAEIRVSLKLEGGSRCERTVSLSHPLACADTLLKLVRLELAAHPPDDAVEGVMLAAKPVPRRVTQHNLFAPPRPSPAKLAVTLTRLKDLVGPGNIGAPALCDTHRPRAFALAPFTPGEGGGEEQPATVLGFRCFRPAVEAEVLEERKYPAYVNSRVATGRVRKCAGPWRADGDWWSQGRWELQEWDIELPRGIYRLSCELPSQVWRLVGAYD